MMNKIRPPLLGDFFLYSSEPKNKTMTKEFINGFASWQETHFEVVSIIVIELAKDKTTSTVIEKCYYGQGTGGVYELAEDLSNEFEKIHKDRKWDGDFFDEIENFLNTKLFS